jgi:hypothetical protein
VKYVWVDFDALVSAVSSFTIVIYLKMLHYPINDALTNKARVDLVRLRVSEEIRQRPGLCHFMASALF